MWLKCNNEWAIKTMAEWSKCEVVVVKETLSKQDEIMSSDMKLCSSIFTVRTACVRLTDMNDVSQNAFYLWAV